MTDHKRPMPRRRQPAGAASLPAPKGKAAGIWDATPLPSSSRQRYLSPGKIDARQAGAFALLFYGAQAINYLHLLAIMWLMDAAHYGAFAAIMGAAYMSAAVAVAFQTVTATAVAQGAAGPAYHGSSRPHLVGATMCGAVIGAGILLALPLLTSALSLPPADIAIMAIAAALAQPTGTAYGILQGKGQFLKLGALQALAAAVRLLSGAGLVTAGLGPAGGAAGVIVGYMLTLCLAAPELLSSAARPHERASSGIPSGMGIGLLATLAAAAPTALDVLLARHLLAPDQSGAYALMATIVRLGIFLSLPVPHLLVPHVALLVARGVHTSPRVLSAATLAGAIAAAVAVSGAAAMTIMTGLGQALHAGGPSWWHAGALAGPAAATACCAYLWTARGACLLEGYLLAASPLGLAAAILLHHSSASDALAAAAVSLAALAVLMVLAELGHAHRCPGRRVSEG